MAVIFSVWTPCTSGRQNCTLQRQDILRRGMASRQTLQRDLLGVHFSHPVRYSTVDHSVFVHWDSYQSEEQSCAYLTNYLHRS